MQPLHHTRRTALPSMALSDHPNYNLTMLQVHQAKLMNLTLVEDLLYIVHDTLISSFHNLFHFCFLHKPKSFASALYSCGNHANLNTVDFQEALMKNSFSPNAPFYSTLVQITNLIFLNILWLICCIPVFTAGAATSALCQVLFSHISGNDDAVWKPFWKSFFADFKQGTAIWLPLLILGVFLIYDGIYLRSTLGLVLHPLWLAFGLLTLLWMIVITYAFPLIARYDASLGRCVRNCFTLFLLHPIQSSTMILINAVPWLIMLFLPDLFWRSGIFWAMIGFSGTYYLSCRICLQLFDHYSAGANVH